jgi:hypothetical protein
MNLMDVSTTHRTPDSREPGRTPNGPLPRYSSLADPADVVHQRSALPYDRVSYLKVLVMSLLREIESLEGTVSLEETVSDESNEGGSLQGEVRRFEAELIRSALVRTGGRQRRAARLLGTKVTTLNTKIKRYKIRIDDPTHGEDIKRGSQVSSPATQSTSVKVIRTGKHTVEQDTRASSGENVKCELLNA